MTDVTIQVTINQSHWIVASANHEGISVNELIIERQLFLTTQIQAGMKVSQNSRGWGRFKWCQLPSIFVEDYKNRHERFSMFCSYLTRCLSEPHTTLNNPFIPVYLTFLG